MTPIRFPAVALATILVSLTPSAFAAAPTYVDGEVIVKYREGTIRSLAAQEGLQRRLGVLSVQRMAGNSFEHLAFDTRGLTVEQAVAELERDPTVEYAQPNFILRTTATEIPGKGGRPALKSAPADVSPPVADPNLSKAWGVVKTGASKAWARTKGSRSVLVAVIDTGIDYNHPDLAANMWRNPGFGRVNATGVDPEGRPAALATDRVGWDFVHNDNLPFDDVGHGTHVAGTIGAVGGNGVGVSGVSQRVSLLAVKFLDADGSGSTANAIRSIDYAIARGARVLNNSWGGSGSADRALRDAVARSERAGALFVAAAGNDGSNNDQVPFAPASVNVPNVLAVAATTSADGRATFSNYGVKTVHMGAPGHNVYSTTPNGKYATFSGTSMAAPHVSGAAALLWSLKPGLSYAQVKKKLMDTGDSVGALRGTTVTGRRLNVEKALR